MEEGDMDAAAPADLVVKRLEKAVEEIGVVSDYRNAYKRHFCNLSRRIKLLAPMFEELQESKKPIPERLVGALRKRSRAVDSVNDLLRLGREGSRIFLVLEHDKVMKKFQGITSHMELALNEITFDEINIPDEIKEQVELVHSQFRRAKEQFATIDIELYNDVSTVYHSSADAKIGCAIIRRLAEKLPLTTISDLTQESLACMSWLLSVVVILDRLLKRCR